MGIRKALLNHAEMSISCQTGIGNRPWESQNPYKTLREPVFLVKPGNAYKTMRKAVFLVTKGWVMGHTNQKTLTKPCGNWCFLQKGDES